MIGPYSTNEIYCGHNVDMMAAMPDGCVDLTVTSPPYDNLRTYQGYNFDFEGVARELYRITRQGGVVVWVVADATIKGSETGTSFRQALHFMSLGFNLHDTMIYEVAGTGAKGSNLAYWQSFEYMFVLSKGRPNVVNRIADKKNVKAGCVNGHSLRGKNDGQMRESEIYRTAEMSVRPNVWRYQPGNNGNDQTGHPAPFPEALARDHIVSWSNSGALVFDPFMGSGTTAKMAKQLGRDYLGFDVSQEYVDIARKRVDAVAPSLLQAEAA